MSHTATLFASCVLLTAAAKIKEKKPIKTGSSSGHIINLKQSILETLYFNGPEAMSPTVRVLSPAGLLSIV
jgi:hypothetical protein